MPSINIIEENEDFLIINKPSGLSFHNEQGESGAFTLLQESENCQLWPVHRLDKITSGLLIFAKNKLSATLFGELFAQKQIQKTYLAISDKKPNKKQGKIIGDMQKARNGSWKLTKQVANPAITHFICGSLTPGKRLFLVTPTTGKTHQIRVALKSIGAPILGDKRYSGAESDRGYLHAYKISFLWKEKPLSFICPPTEGELFLLSELITTLTILEDK